MKTQYSILLRVAALALLISGASVPAFCESLDPSMKEIGAVHERVADIGNNDSMGDMMGLADDQAIKMKLLQSEMKKNLVRASADLKSAETELAEIMKVKDFDLEKANPAVTRIAEIKKAYYLETIKTIRDMRILVSEEQFRKSF